MLGYQSEQSGNYDTLRLEGMEGTADQFLILLNDPESQSNEVIFQRIGGSSQIRTFGIEKVSFGSPVGNNIRLYGENVVLETARQMIEAYRGSTASSAVSSSGAGRNWHAVEAIELGIAPSLGTPKNGYTLNDGVYRSTVTSKDFGTNDAVATIELGLVDNVRTLMVAFKGSDPFGPGFDIGDWIVDLSRDTDIFYTLHYKPLVDGLKAYLDDVNNDIYQVLVSGHSLGGAMAQHFISDIQAFSSIRGYTYGSIGGTADTMNAEQYLTNFLNVNDIANTLNTIREGRAGGIVFINSTNKSKISTHFKEGYEADVNLIMKYAQEITNSIFTDTNLAQALNGDGWHFGDIQVAVGTNNEDRILVTEKDFYSIGDQSNDYFSVMKFGSGGSIVDTYSITTLGRYKGETGHRIIDGGMGAHDRLCLAKGWDDYNVAKQEDGYRITDKKSGKEIAIVQNIEEIWFGGGLWTIDGVEIEGQKPSSSAKSFTVEANGEDGGYAEIGDGNLSVKGSLKGDMITAGRGDKTIKSGSGADTVLVNSLGASESLTSKGRLADDVLIDGGKGDDLMIGGKGNETYIVDSSADVIMDTGGADLVKSSVDYTLLNGIEDLILIGKAISGTGNKSANSITGNAAANRLEGGRGVDTLTGGGGKDTFVFSTRLDSGKTPAKQDTITDFSGKLGDRIDLSAIDANTKLAGEQDFAFIGVKSFSGKAGELRYEKSVKDTYIYADVNGDKVSDFAVHLDDKMTLNKGYFIL